MDEAQLKKLLSEEDVPAIDENAKKRILNVAIAEFEGFSSKTEEKHQGNSIFARLMGRSNEKQRNRPMNKRLVYSGMATAMVVVLAVGTAFGRSRN